MKTMVMMKRLTTVLSIVFVSAFAEQAFADDDFAHPSETSPASEPELLPSPYVEAPAVRGSTTTTSWYYYTAAPPPPQTQTMSMRPPARGTAPLIVGGIFTGLGGLDILSGALITAANSDGPGPIVLAIGGAEVLTGVILLTVGSVQRSHYKEWKRQHLAGGITPTGYAFSF